MSDATDLVQQFLVGMRAAPPPPENEVDRIKKRFPELPEDFVRFYSVANGACGAPFGQDQCRTEIRTRKEISRDPDSGSIRIGQVALDPLTDNFQLVFCSDADGSRFEVLNPNLPAESRPIGNSFALLIENIRESATALSEGRLSRWRLSEGELEASPIKSFERIDGMELKSPFFQSTNVLSGVLDLNEVRFLSETELLYTPQRGRCSHVFSLDKQEYRFHVWPRLDARGNYGLLFERMGLRFFKHKDDGYKFIDVNDSRLVYALDWNSGCSAIPINQNSALVCLYDNQSATVLSVSPGQKESHVVVSIELNENESTSWEVYGVAVSEDAQRFAIGLGALTSKGTKVLRRQIRVFTLDGGDEVVRFDVGFSGSFAFSRDGRNLLPSYVSEHLQIHDATSGEVLVDQKVYTATKGPQVSVVCPFVELDGVGCYSDRKYNAVHFIDLKTGEKVGRYTKFGSHDGICGSPDGQRLCVWYRGDAYFFDAKRLTQYVLDGEPEQEKPVVLINESRLRDATPLDQQQVIKEFLDGVSTNGRFDARELQQVFPELPSDYRDFIASCGGCVGQCFGSQGPNIWLYSLEELVSQNKYYRDDEVLPDGLTVVGSWEQMFYFWDHRKKPGHFVRCFFGEWDDERHVVLGEHLHIALLNIREAEEAENEKRDLELWH